MLDDDARAIDDISAAAMAAALPRDDCRHYEDLLRRAIIGC